MSVGWKCPGCGACYAPWVAVCGNCKAIVTPSPAPGIFPRPNITCGGPGDSSRGQRMDGYDG